MKKFLSQLKILFYVSNDDLKIGLNELYQDGQTRLFILTALFFNILIWVASILFTANLKDDVVALHHNIYFGINLIGDSRQVYFIPLLGLIILVINIVFSFLIRMEGGFFTRLFTASAILINIFLLLGLGSIILINFR